MMETPLMLNSLLGLNPTASAPKTSLLGGLIDTLTNLTNPAAVEDSKGDTFSFSQAALDKAAEAEASAASAPSVTEAVVPAPAQTSNEQAVPAQTGTAPVALPPVATDTGADTAALVPPTAAPAQSQPSFGATASSTVSSGSSVASKDRAATNVAQQQVQSTTEDSAPATSTFAEGVYLAQDAGRLDVSKLFANNGSSYLGSVFNALNGAGTDTAANANGVTQQILMRA